MRLEGEDTPREGNRLIIRDQPIGFWLFYSLFIAGGSIALILSLRGQVLEFKPYIQKIAVPGLQE
jgi:hypothetical protein